MIQTIHVTESDGTIKIIVQKKSRSPHTVASAVTTSHIRARSGSRRAIGVAAGLAKRGYRPDLRAVSLL